MKICEKHWGQCRASIDEHGMTPLICTNGEEAVERVRADLAAHGPSPENFDPLISMNFHWAEAALSQGGLYLMSENDTGENDGHYCPLCEYESHSDPETWDTKTEIDRISKQMASWCREKGLIPKVQ